MNGVTQKRPHSFLLFNSLFPFLISPLLFLLFLKSVTEYTLPPTSKTPVPNVVMPLRSPIPGTSSPISLSRRVHTLQFYQINIANITIIPESKKRF